MTWMFMDGCVICLSNGGEMMSKRTIAPRNRLRRQGDFWEEGMLLTDEDRAILRPLIEKAQELGYTPIRAEVPNNAKIKGRFRCWKDAVKAAGLPALNDPEQMKKRITIDSRVFENLNTPADLLPFQHN